MRKGKVNIESIKFAKPMDAFFEVDAKEIIRITSIKGGVVDGFKIPTSGPVKTQSARLRKITVVDNMTNEIFQVDFSQQRYLYDIGQDSEVNFDVQPGGVMNVFLKNEKSIAEVKKMNCLAMGYGEYVARMKSMNKGASDFFTWYSDEIGV